MRYLKITIFCIFSFNYFLNKKIGLKVNEGLDYRNFYGIAWRGSAHENLQYAKQMGYKYVFYQKDMEKDPLSNGFYFYLESPEYLLYNRVISTTKKYKNEEIQFYSKYCVLKDDSLVFPQNLATGWFFNDSTFSAELDFQQKNVVAWTVRTILNKIAEIEAHNPNFHFGGFAWDVPQISGDFWSRNSKRGGRQVSSEYWSLAKVNTTSNTSLNSLYKSYSVGRADYYRELFSKTREIYPNAKFIIEPNRIFEDWVMTVAKLDNAFDITPDLICQESCGTEFITDQRIYDSKLVDKSKVGSTTPNCFGEKENRGLAANAAINGATFGWFGRFGGTGDMPNYKSIKDVPARLKLIRVLTTWENMNNTPIGERSWDGTTYKSTTAVVSDKLIAIKKPKLNAYVIVFLNKDGVFRIPKDSKIDKVYELDSLFQEMRNVEMTLNVKKNQISPSSKSLQKGFVVYTK